MILVYFKDLIVTGNTPAAIACFKKHLSTCFYMKDLGFLKYFLGIKVARNGSDLYLSQQKYAMDIISETSLFGAKLGATSVE